MVVVAFGAIQQLHVWPCLPFSHDAAVSLLKALFFRFLPLQIIKAHLQLNVGIIPAHT